ncbi:MAG: GHKL domain-containing protein [Gammaproteobacteria bacterium]|nr:GHKL domain-containing protein [Gammaproteobacteria bacterium]NNC56491.1 GHKL domain-containing protein [Woeseiaceae bacterium]
MRSLSSRLLVSVSVLLLLFFGATIAVLDTAFSEAGEQARRDILDGHLVALLAAAEPDDTGKLMLPERLREPRFENIGSGLYAELRDTDNQVLWRSRSALGLEVPSGVAPELGNHLFAREILPDGTPLLTLSLAVQWEFADGTLKPYVFKVAESLDSFNAQIAGFRRQLFGWFAAVALTMLLAFSMLLRGLLKPLRLIETEITEIEEGKRASLSGEFPTELTGVARNMNLLIDSERARSDRYRYTLDNLAHSLKTPLAAMRALLNDHRTEGFSGRVNEQIDRMDEIVRYQLRKPAASVTENLVLKAVPVEQEVERLVDGLRKVYHDKHPEFEVRIESGMQFRGDTGDFLELAGNLLDNACKWCKRRVRISVVPSVGARAIATGMVLTVSDDGPGIPKDAAEALLQRGMRLDESTPGHGIGLAVVAEIARSYGGRLSIKKSADLGGAEIMVSIPPLANARAQ